MSLSSILPRPKAPKLTKSKWASDDEDEEQTPKAPVKAVQRGPPPYGKRDGFVPRTPEDFGDGGAFPEISVVQYPLDLGRQRSASAKRIETLPLQTDGDGNIRYDLILRQGDKDGKKIVHSQFSDILEKDVKEDDASLERPDEDTIRETTEKTRLALEKLVDGRIKSAQPKSIVQQKNVASYVKYTPASQNGAQNSGAQSRVIKMVEAPVDPMAPPKFKHKKVPVVKDEAPVPVMHSPPRKVTAEEQKNWVIPPCISNWKNAKGYTIPLDKRLAADGRGLQEITINDNFAKLSEALFIADRHARDEVKIRGEMQNKLAAKEKREREEKLRIYAQRAREERAGLVSGATSSAAAAAPTRAEPSSVRSGADSGSESDDSVDEDEKKRVLEREELRKERQRQREREIRMSHMGAETKAKVLSKSTDRDISEKIALGLAQPTASKESMFDQRLFNQSQGLSSGFNTEDSYDLYDKPLFQGSTANAIYRPKKDTSDHSGSIPGVATEKIERMLGEGGTRRGFQGTEGGRDVARDGPVQFEREQDVFGIDEFMSSAKRGRGESGREEKGKRARRD
ncbi:SKIP/SNW domain-containing protein [Fimicolochytrium jonesii]|uniref:SKIP/SNW domain-containing protein n=1 Tax=Fimicolochytrium jonesii TaxID=1396493 RepID=UPI0022FDE397|nr:SKIP/SNW domain-containing protein [Fimicolochytrium jonesii]KAI8822453.1 SKIP/SNW domain-containing protein [Fimicolochytrium jonesii]